VSDIQRESQEVLHSVKESHFQDDFEASKNRWDSVLKDAIFKEMAAKIG
jgi:hypothetical protein